MVTELLSLCTLYYRPLLQLTLSEDKKRFTNYYIFINIFSHNVITHTYYHIYYTLITHSLTAKSACACMCCWVCVCDTYNFPVYTVLLIHLNNYHSSQRLLKFSVRENNSANAYSASSLPRLQPLPQNDPHQVLQIPLQIYSQNGVLSDTQKNF